jgi:type I restriction enzyme S subunit
LEPTGARSQYDKYGDSGVEWLGEIPDHWNTAKLKFLCDQSAVYGANRSADEYTRDGVRFLRTTDIDEFGDLSSEGVYIDPGSVEEYMLEDGDLLLSRSGTVGRSFVYSSSEHEPAAYAGYLVRFVLDEKKLNPKYAFYFTKSGNFDEWLRSNSIESTIGNVSGDKYANMPVVVPPLDEQSTIATYLDRETERIDALIEKKEELIDLLEEKRTALISRVVTKGLDGDVEMQDSGVEWLGKIPSHWDVAKYSYYLYSSMGETILKQDLNEDGKIPVYSATESGEIFGYVDESDTLLETGDLIIPARGNSIGYVKLVDRPCTTTQTTIYSKLLPLQEGLINVSYVKYYLNANRDELFFFDQTAIPQITVEQVESNPLVIPPVDEQRAIATFLDSKTERIDELIEQITEGIERLKEYRTALISAAVTGQIDVREEVATAPAE